ncbi:hypothetical protein ACIA8G_18150 [Lentzea sp. NPDC051213]|uniref:hypothetical protein n=1 Tax=Lentzea sp. NPDC051213 TaxID=3364126 RepID=UPI0037A59457
MNAPQGWQQQPPQQGWQQPPGPGYPPPQGQGHGYPPQGPGYPPQGPGHPPQRKKSKAPIVIAAVIGSILLLGGLGTGGFFFFNVRKDHGDPLRTVAQPELCKNVSPETLAKARTTNPAQIGTYEQKFDGSTLTACSWDKTKGRDGSGVRMLTVYTEQTDTSGEKAFELRLQQASTSTQATLKKVDGVGDQASVVVIPRGSGTTELVYLVRRGEDVVSVEYFGWDPGLFSPSKPDTAELEATAKAVLDDVLGKL